MTLEVTDKRKNTLMKREEAEMTFDHKGKATPSRSEIASSVGKKLGVNEDLIIIN